MDVPQANGGMAALLNAAMLHAGETAAPAAPATGPAALGTAPGHAHGAAPVAASAATRAVPAIDPVLLAQSGAAPVRQPEPSHLDVKVKAEPVDTRMPAPTSRTEAPPSPASSDVIILEGPPARPIAGRKPAASKPASAGKPASASKSASAGKPLSSKTPAMPPFPMYAPHGPGPHGMYQGGAHAMYGMPPPGGPFPFPFGPGSAPASFSPYFFPAHAVPSAPGAVSAAQRGAQPPSLPKSAAVKPAPSNAGSAGGSSSSKVKVPSVPAVGLGDPSFFSSDDSDDCLDPKERKVSVAITCYRKVPSGTKAGTFKLEGETRTLILKLHGLGRINTLIAFLTVHGLESFFMPDANGFPFKCHWKGSPGGKKDASTISSDDDFKQMLKAFFKTNERSMSISFDTTQMARWAKTPPTTMTLVNGSLVSAPAQAGPSGPGTQVPNLGRYSDKDVAIGEKMAEIEKKYGCPRHPYVCIRDLEDDNSPHTRLTIPLVRVWAGMCVDGRASIDAAPRELLQAGETIKPRGRKFSDMEHPTHALPAPSAAIPDYNQLLATIALLSRAPAPMPLPPAPAARLSSPPPSDEDELFVVLSAYRKEYGIMLPDMLHMYEAFSGAGYRAASFETADIARIQELSRQNEGMANALKAFCTEWSQNNQRRKRRRLHY